MINPSVKETKVPCLEKNISTSDKVPSTKVQGSQKEANKYICPYKECHSESKNAQSIKVHLALVHYKKLIQAEFPNWKKQKCDECDKSFGQMTAYYLHMANHKKFQYMNLPPSSMVSKDANMDNSFKHIEIVRKNSGVSASSRHQTVSKASAAQSSPSTIVKAVEPGIKVAGKKSNNSDGISYSGAKITGIDSVEKTSATRSKSIPEKIASKGSSYSTRSMGVNSPSVSTGGLAGRSAPPGPPGPPTSIIRSSSQDNVRILSQKTSVGPNSQRRLSAPYSIVTKRTSSLDRPAPKDAKKARGS